MPPTKGVTIELDKPRTLRYGGRAFEAFEKETGRNLLAGGLDGLSFTDTLTLIWVGCLHEDPKFARDVVVDHVDMAGLLNLREPLKQAFEQAFPSQNGKEPDPKAEPAQG